MNALSGFDAERLEQRLLALDSRRQLAFGIGVCEGLLPNYERFRTEAKWGDSNILTDAMIRLRNGLLNEELPPSNVAKELADRCEHVAPAPQGFESLYVTAAQDACFAICCLLDFIIYPDVERIVQAATYATDSVDLVIQESDDMSASDPSLEEKILAHPLMQRELRRQEEMLTFLERSSKWIVEWEVLTRIAVGSGQGNVVP